jgi:hypothetical protein
MDEQQAVNPAESAPAEKQQVVNEAQPTEGQTTTQPITETAQSQPAGQQSYEAVDEFGVPYKNRTFEWKRKYEETIEKMPSLVEEAVKNSFQQYGKPQEKEYTIAELEAYAIDKPEYRPWVEQQKAELLRKTLTKEVEEKFKTVERRKEADVKKQQALNYVMSNYSDAFVKNAQGQVVGWNNQNPLTQQIGMIMQDPRFANDPEGLIAAADMAYGRMLRSQQGVAMQKEQQLKAEVRHLQKQTMVEGGGKSNSQPVPEFRKAIDKAKQSGTLKDTAAALEAIAKARRAEMEK